MRRSVASAVEVGVGEDEEGVEEEEEEVEAVVMPERYALGGACRVLAGMPAPLGATALDGGVNFAVYSAGASAASLCLFTPDDLEAVSSLQTTTTVSRVPREVLLSFSVALFFFFNPMIS